MDTSFAAAVAQEALMLVLLVSAPPLAASLVVSLVVGVLQAATRIQDPTVAAVPRVALVLGSLVLAGPWIAEHLVQFTQLVLNGLPDAG